MIGNHFKKKFSKRPPPGIIVTEVLEKEFSEKIETFGTAISKKSETFKIKRDDLCEELKLKNFVKKYNIKPQKFVNTEKIHNFALYLGNYPDLSIKNIDFICKVINDV